MVAWMTEAILIGRIVGIGRSDRSMSSGRGCSWIAAYPETGSTSS